MELDATPGERKVSAPVNESPSWLEGHVLNPFVNGIAITPYNAVANAVNFATPGDLLGKAEALPVSQTEFLTPGWFVQNVSGGLGAIVPYVIAGKAAGGVMKGTAGRFALNGPTAGILTSDIAAATTGAAVLDFARDTHEGETRFGNAVGGGVAMFAFAKGNALTGVAENILQRGVTRFGVGTVGGMAGYAGSRLTSGESVNGEDLLKAGITGGTMNVALPPTQHMITRGFERAGTTAHDVWNSKPVRDVWNSNSVQGAYWSVRGNTREGFTTARQATYAFLNEHNLTHPLKRFMERNAPREMPVVKPALTAENNPVTAFEKALPEYFQRIQKGEEAYELNATGNRYDVVREMQQVRGDFAAKLMEVWHGKDGKPGMKHYTDAELATQTTSVERVAQIRNALTQSSRREHRSDKLTDALVELAPKGVTENLSYETYAMDGIGFGREKFYGYDEASMRQKMGMPQMHHHRDHHNYNTPNEWMPYDATPLLANLFHGTMSNSLKSVMSEGGILSSRELRLRGLSQTTGESAGQEFPRHEVSITRDFNEAFAYHRHSPEFLTEFPVVYGISKSVAPRIRSAGMLEPGELLIPRMGLGHNLLTRLGLRNPDITNMYVPDAEVHNVTQQLWANRVKGVKVVGFNQIPEPKWHPEPTVQEMIDMGYR
jgi:hypothetical protein